MNHSQNNETNNEKNSDIDSEGPSVKGRTKIINKIKGFFTRRFKRKKALDNKDISLQVKPIIASSLESEEEMARSIDIFTDKTVEDVMVPRSDIIAINIDSSISDLNNLIIKHSHTRTLIYKESLDDIVGFVHIKDLFNLVAQEKKFGTKKVGGQKPSIRKLVRQHIISPHSMKLIDLLAQMQINRTHIAVVIDEYGGTDGIVTIEDIIEEIVGRIDDEHDIESDDEGYKIIRPGLIVTNARVEIEEIENAIGKKLKSEDDDFDTIGGMVMAKFGSVPKKGKIIKLDENITVEIMESTARTIKQMKLIYSA